MMMTVRRKKEKPLKASWPTPFVNIARDAYEGFFLLDILLRIECATYQKSNGFQLTTTGRRLLQSAGLEYRILSLS